MRHLRALAIVTVLSATVCSDWVPASVAEATGQDHVRVREKMTFRGRDRDMRVVAVELEYPSREALIRLRRQGRASRFIGRRRIESWRRSSSRSPG